MLLPPSELDAFARDAVRFDAAFAQKDHVTAEQLLDYARTLDDSVSRATVYRTLPIMTESALLREVDIGTGEKFYHPNKEGGSTQVAQVVCLDCDRIFEISAPFMEWYGNTVSSKLCKEFASMLANDGKLNELKETMARLISQHGASSELLLWLGKERSDEFADILGPEVFRAMLTVMERDQFNERRSNRLRDFILDDQELLVELIGSADFEVIKDLTRALQYSPCFDDMDKRSLLARIVKNYPAIQSLITGEAPRQDHDGGVLGVVLGLGVGGPQGSPFAPPPQPPSGTLGSGCPGSLGRGPCFRALGGKAGGGERHPGTCVCGECACTRTRPPGTQARDPSVGVFLRALPRRQSPL